jgi:hypothetical protein
MDSNSLFEIKRTGKHQLRSLQLALLQGKPNNQMKVVSDLQVFFQHWPLCGQLLPVSSIAI